MIASIIVNVVLFITVILLLALRSRGGQSIVLKEDMPEDFEKLSSKKKNQRAVMLFQNEIYGRKIIKYDFRNRKLILRVNIKK